MNEPKAAPGEVFIVMDDTGEFWDVRMSAEENARCATLSGGFRIVRYVNADTIAAEVAKAVAAKQAQIDELMLEFCPNEMTDEQRKEWAANQVATTGGNDGS